MQVVGLACLSVRRDYLSLRKCYKIVFGIIDNLNFSDLFETPKSQRTRANHTYKLYTKRAKVNAYITYSFFVRIISLWNSLPSSIVESDNINVFKFCLK